MDLNKKFIMLVGESTVYSNGESINSWYKDTADTISELIQNLKDYYKNIGTTWEEKPYSVRVYKLIHEPNGYIHTSGLAYFRDSTKNYWLK